MNKNQLYSKDEVIRVAKELKQRQSEYIKTIKDKPNIKTDGIDSVLDWMRDILLTLKK